MNDGATFAATRAPAASPQRDAIVVGGRGGLMALLIKNQLLTLVTLGFYRFWARTALRRFLWSRVVVDGDALEYTGQGGELCRGFLKAMVMLVPFFAVFGVIEAFLDPGTTAFLVEKALYFTAVVALIAVAQFHARRYRLSRTQWRGIRFAQTGSAVDYAWLTLGWGVRTVLTLGFAFPWLRWVQYDYLIRHTAFGGTVFAFSGSDRGLVAPWLLVLLIGWPVVIMGAMMSFDEQIGLFDLLARVGLSPSTYAALLFVLMPLLGLAIVNYRVREFRTVAAATRLGSISVESLARGRAVLALVAGYGLAVAAIVVPAAIFFVAVLPSVLRAAPSMSAGVLSFAIVAIGYLVLGSLWTFIVTFGALRHFAATLRMNNVEALATIVQGTQPVPTTGEGLADSFDVG